ncbi:MAG: putative membrane protein [Bacteroidia bacterium]|jgi:uncharacterized membrane protein
MLQEINWSSAIFIILGLTGLVYFIVALILQKYPPQNINNFYGYRTKSSRKDQGTWDFAQTFSAKVTQKLGLILMVLSLVGLIVQMNNIIEVFISLGLIAVSVIVLLYSIERAIKRSD